MTLLKHILALILLLLSAVGVALCIAGVVGVWVVRPALTKRTDRTFGRVETALGKAGDTLQTLDQLFKRAGENLKEVRDTAPPPGSDADKVNSFRAFASRKVAQEMIPKLGDVRPNLEKLIEATAVANSILGDLQELPTGTLPFLDRDRLSQIDDRATELSSATRELANLFGAPVAGADNDANRVISRIEEVLTRITALIGEYRTRVEEVRSQARALQMRVDSGIQWGVVAATVLLLWLALAQGSLFVHAWKWLRGTNTNRPRE